MFLFAARAQGIEEPLKVVVDTGSKLTFCITQTGLDKVWRRTGTWTPPPGRVLLQFGRGADTMLQKMDTRRVRDWFDFVLGRALLCQLRAAIDYVDSTMTLMLNRKQFRLHLLTH